MKNVEENTFCEKCGIRLNPTKENFKESKISKSEDKKINKELEAKVATLLFEKEKYLSYIGKIQKSITMTYAYWIGFGLIFTLIILAGSSYQSEMNRFAHHDSNDMMKIAAFVPPIIGLAIAHARTLENKIRVQEMKWKTDFYSKHIN